MKDLKKHIINYLVSINTMQVATLNEQGNPWLANVYFNYDQELNFYFISRPTRNHSEHIRNHPNVSFGFCKEHQSPFEMPCQGIQAEGECQEISPEHSDFEALKETYLNRFPKSEPMFEHHFIYQISPSKITLFDEVNLQPEPWQSLIIK